MNFKTTDIPEIKVISETVNYNTIDGYRQNVFSWTQLRKNGIEEPFIYESEVRIESINTLRGLYYQSVENMEAILLRCVSGKILLKVVDIRPESSTYRKVVTLTLSGDECKYVYIPYGFAHGYITLAENTYLQYKSDNFYFAQETKVINCLDKMLSLNWGTKDYIVSAKEKYARGIAEIEKDYFLTKVMERENEGEENA